MPPSATIAIPTRRRADYLEVALASVAPQGREHGAEMLVVEDDAESAATRAAAERHGARYLALGGERGINVARNACLEAAQADLVCFLDDDVRVWEGWLAELLAGAAADPDAEAFGGPIRPDLADFRWPLCGREPPPVTALALGPEDSDVAMVWGANLAVRRAAVERIGSFRCDLNFSGDEEEWLRRLRAAGGRIRYLARAGVDHRRTGADATLRALSRAALRRGIHARRWDEAKGTAPGLGGELRVLAGCGWHLVRRRCANGAMLGAMAAGRILSALRVAGHPVAGGPEAAAGVAGGDDVPEFLSGTSGTLSRRGRLEGMAADAAADLLLWPQKRRLRRAAAAQPPRRVLVLGVARPANVRRTRRVTRELRRSRHDVRVVLAPGAPGRGKWANLDALLAARPVAGADWLLLVDDDVEIPRGFLDVFLLCAEAAGLVLAQPAHGFASHAAWPVTRRRPGVLVRETRFVEIGPVTALAAPAFDVLLPFSDVGMGWGLDAHWSAVAAERGWPLGVVDATPVRHARPVAGDYPREAAVAQAHAFLAGRPYVTRAQAAETVRSHRRLEG